MSVPIKAIMIVHISFSFFLIRHNMDGPFVSLDILFNTVILLEKSV